ncbi:hypothetical protein LPC_0130 [Legionella pneumophila str. Corby]|nr:hypothetical protein LPC_0130 [Legionella pneumophila str. Corby]
MQTAQICVRFQTELYLKLAEQFPDLISP